MKKNSLINIIKNKITLKRVPIINLIDHDYSYSNRDEVIIDVIRKNPTRLLTYVLPYITTKNIKKDITLECDDEDWRDYYKCDIYVSLNIDEFSRITSLSLTDYGILEIVGDEEYIHNSGEDFDIELDVSSYDSLSGDVKLNGHFKGGSSMLLSMDYNDVVARLSVTGLERNSVTPSWVDYLMEGCFNIEYKNNKMAFFNIFAAFDNFINAIHEDIFQYYLEKYKVCKNENMKEEIKDKIRLFSNQEKRLRDKLRHIFSELNMTKSKGFRNLNEFFDMWGSKYIKVRDKIAHGSLYEETYDIGEVTYTILTLIFSILIHVDLAENQWDDLIVF